MNLKKLTKTVAAACLLFAAAVAARADIGAFETIDLSGAAVDQSLLAGANVTVLNVWGTYCPPCIREMPSLGKLAKEMAPRGVRVVGVLYDWFDSNGQLNQRQLGKARAIVEKTGADYPHILLQGELMEDMGDFNAIPQTFIVDARGKVLASFAGALPEKQWRKVINDALDLVK